MEEAIKKVLDMLEAGKISPEEAERLIRAIKESSKREQDAEFSMGNLGGLISEIVNKSLKTAFSSAFKFANVAPRKDIEMEIPSREKLKIIAQGGDIEVESEKRENIKIKGMGAKLEALDKKENNEVFIELLAGELEILMPPYKDIEILLQGGDAEVKGSFRNMDINIKGGDAELHSEFEKSKVEIYGGEFTLKTSRKPLKINVKNYEGNIELPDEFRKEAEYYLYGEGEYRELELAIYGGDFELKFKE